MDTPPSTPYSVLFVDDEPDLLETFRLSFDRDFPVRTAQDGHEALRLLEGDPSVAVLVADQKMPGMHGLEVIRRALALRPNIAPIILTGYTDAAALVDAINLQRIHRYVQKPWDTKALRLTIQEALETFHLRRENARLVQELRRANERLSAENAHLRAETSAPQDIVGTSSTMEALRARIGRAAVDPVTVLVQGESGTGKELVARAIHAGSPRRDRMFVARNCAAFAESLLEAELFGHKKGAFTGATADRRGIFEIADGGTLFLDEISETPLGLQAKLLRVLQEGEIVRIGDERPRRVDVRIVAATNRHLARWVADGRFRQDLYYRLNVYPLTVPPLRDRRDDIPALVSHLLAMHCARRGRPAPSIETATLRLLTQRDYPGNVRELSNLLEQAVVNAHPDEEIVEAHFSEPLAPDATADDLDEQDDSGRLDDARRHFESTRIREVLQEHGGNKTRAAKALGMTYRGLLKKMARVGLRPA